MDIQLEIAVESMAGNVVWGPALIDASAPLSLLRDSVAESMGVPSPAVHLVFGDRTLHGSLHEEAVPHEATIKCVLDVVRGAIEASMIEVRAALQARSGGQWQLDALVGEAAMPNDEHCPEFQDLDWGSLEYTELTLKDIEAEVNNHAGKFQQISREFYFGSVDSDGAPAGYGFILKQATCWGEYTYDGRCAYHGLFLPVKGYKMPMSSLCGAKLVQGAYQAPTKRGCFETRFLEKSGLFDGTEAEEE